jgi:glutathione S-transferase
MATTVQFYYAAHYDRSARARWLCCELGIPFEDHLIDMASGEHKRAPFTELNPFGQVPAAKIGQVSLFDSMAICQWILETNPGSALVPMPGTKERAAYLSWLNWAGTTFDRAVFTLYAFKRTPENQTKRDEAYAKLKPHLDVLQAKLAGSAFILDGKFSTVDIVVGYGLMLLNRDLALNEYPALQSYLNALAARPAAKKARLFDA